jgi:hypothetical protein
MLISGLKLSDIQNSLPFGRLFCRILFTLILRITGLEPARLLAIEPKSIASANSAISANDYCPFIIADHLLPVNVF